MKKLLVLTAIILLSGCGLMTTKEVVPTPTLVQRPELTVPDIQPAQQLNFKWYVITKDNFDEKIKELQKDGNTSIIFFAITPEGYQALSMNTAELRRYIQQQNAVIKALKEYYKNTQKEEVKK